MCTERDAWEKSKRLQLVTGGKRAALKQWRLTMRSYCTEQHYTHKISLGSRLLSIEYILHSRTHMLVHLRTVLLLTYSYCTVNHTSWSKPCRSHNSILTHSMVTVRSISRHQGTPVHTGQLGCFNPSSAARFLRTECFFAYRPALDPNPDQ